MGSGSEIVNEDIVIQQIIESYKDLAAQLLFDRYRLSGSRKPAFVAALIGRLCLLEAQQDLPRRNDIKEISNA